MKTIIVLSSILLGLAATTIQAAKLDSQLYAKYLCRDKENGFKALVPGSCSQYYECQNSAAQLRACPRFFDALHQICVTKDTGCVETLASVVNVPAGCSGPCCGVSSGYALDPVNDQVYFECQDNSVISKNSCEANMMFNLETLKCSAAASCGDVTTPKPPCTETTTPPCTTTTCETTEDITTTTTKTTTTTTCTTTTCETTEDITTTTCTTTIEAPCNTTTKAPCTEATTTKAPCPLANAVALNHPEQSKEPSNFNLYIRFVCRDKADGFKLVSLTNCNDFYVCSKGVAMLLSCGDKYFNAVKGVCDLPQNTNCHLKTFLA